MKSYKKFIYGLAITPIVLYSIFYIYFAVGMIEVNSKQSIDTSIVLECNEYLKSVNNDLKNVELYYYQGKIYFIVDFENNLSLDESNAVIGNLRKFILKDNISSFFSKEYDELPTLVTINSKDNSYHYKCPYYINKVKNDYKLWYLTDTEGDKIINTIIIDN